VMALLLDSGSVCLALAAGLVASSICTRWNRTLIVAEVLAAVFMSGFGCLFALALFLQVGPYVPGFAWSEFDMEQLIEGAMICTGVAGVWSEGLNSLPAAAVAAWLWTVVEMFLIAALGSGAAM